MSDANWDYTGNDEVLRHPERGKSAARLNAEKVGHVKWAFRWSGMATTAFMLCLLATSACTSAVTPVKVPPDIVAAAEKFDLQPKLSPAESSRITDAFFKGAEKAAAEYHRVPFVVFESFPTPPDFVVDGRVLPPIDQLDLNEPEHSFPSMGVALAALQPADAQKIAEYDLQLTKKLDKDGYQDPDLVSFLKTGNIPAPDDRYGRNWQDQVTRILVIAKGNQQAFANAQPTFAGSFVSAHPVVTGLSILFVGLVALGVGSTALQKFLNDRELERALAVRRALAKHPPVWPPRRPDDWGLETEIRYQQAVRHYQGKARLWQKMGVDFAESAPQHPRIPSWEVHHQAEQAGDPLQIRWAQTEMGDWLRVIWGNRMQPPPKGTPTPVFQSMQRKDNGEWIWAPIPADNKFEWQRGPQRIEDFSYTDADGAPRIVSRPCGHPGYQEPAPIEVDSGVHGTSLPLSDDELVDMGSAPAHPASHAGVGDTRPEAPPAPMYPQSDTYGSSSPLSDDDLVNMGSAPAQQPVPPVPSHKPPQDPPFDPTTYAGTF